MVIAFVLVLGCVTEQPDDTPRPTVTTVKKGVKTDMTVKPDIKNFREAKNSNDLGFCDDIESVRLRDVCIRDVAMNTSNLRACDKITTQSVKDTCFYRIAGARKDKTVCSRVESSKLLDLCNKNV